MRGRTLKLYLVNGDPSGVITAELGVSSVRAVFASRTSLTDLIKRDEATRTGVYLLQGPDPSDPARERVYVGEGDQVKTRLASHDVDESKDFFTKVVLIVSKDEHFTKAHGRFLESKIIDLIRESGRASLANGTQPSFKGLPEAEIADMERVLDEIEILLPVLGFDILRKAGRKAAADSLAVPISSAHDSIISGGDSEIVEFSAEIKKAKATAVERAGEFVVLMGSTAYRCPNESLPERHRDRLRSLQLSGDLVPHNDPELLSFSTDVSFASSSAASSLIGGYSDSGPRTWRVKGRSMSYGEWRNKGFKQ